MFAHHAIKDLVGENKLTVLGDNVLHLIKVSTKYHLGDMVKDIYGIMEPIMVKYEKETGQKFQIFRTYMDGVISPFDSVWFEWLSPDSPDAPKCAALILKSLSPTNRKFDLLTIYPFFYHKKDKGWVFLPIVSSVDMGVQTIKIRWTYDDEYVDKIMLPEDRANLEHMNRYMLSCINLGLLFINCRNVKVRKRYPDENLQKKRSKYGKQPMFTYHVLEIKDMRKKNIYPDDHTTTKMGKLRRHQMPARVAYYTAEKPLFGNPKLTGWYAFKSHWRGDPNKGTIIRDYETEKKGDN